MTSHSSQTSYTLIKNGTLITASDTFTADILIQDEKIALIGQDLDIPDAKTPFLLMTITRGTRRRLSAAQPRSWILSRKTRPIY